MWPHLQIRYRKWRPRKLNPRKRGFLGLPWNVRRQIYILAPLVSNSQIDLNRKHQSSEGDYETLAISLLRVSKVVNREAISILYGLNSFRVDLGHRLEATSSYSRDHHRLIGFTSEAKSYMTSLHIKTGMLQSEFDASLIAAKVLAATEDRKVYEHRRDILDNLEGIVQLLKNA